MNLALAASAPVSLEGIPEAGALTGANAGASVDFPQMLSGIEQLNGQLQTAEGSVASLAVDPSANLNHAIVGMEQTRLSFELALAVRNKILDAYQELMRTQI